MEASEVIQKLDMKPHPEGGYYVETYRAAQQIQLDVKRVRNAATAIFFLLQDHDKSKFHRLASDECWFFHLGQALEIALITPDHFQKIILGNDLQKGDSLQLVIPADTWFAARLLKPEGFTLVSCSVAPGFDFEDFELAEPQQLLNEYPQYQDIIHAYFS